MDPSELSNITREKHPIKTLKEFSNLRRAVHDCMIDWLRKRVISSPIKTEYEEALGVYVEEIEQQVLEAISVFNEKGYRTRSSGFWGKYGECQVIEGPFVIDPDTIATLSSFGITVEITVDWKAKAKAFMGNLPMPTLIDHPHTQIKFYPLTTDIGDIKSTWDAIATLLPDKSGY